MNTGTGATRRWHQARPQRAGLLAVMAGVALLTVACGGNSASTGAGGSSQSAGAAPSASSNAVAFSQCMRSHGIPNYPDPSAVSGDVDPSQLGVSDTVYESARTACRQLYPQPHANAGLTTAQEQQAEGQMLIFAKCMRSHGVPAFPDPNPPSIIWGGSGQLFNVPSSIDHNSSQFTSARNSCKSLMPSNAALGKNKGGGQ